MNNIFWALAAVYALGEPIELVDVYATRQHCEHISKNYKLSACYPVNVMNRNEVIKQINAINIIVLNNEKRTNSSNNR